ncbi:MAG: twin-arginine translocase TatA/TatE family subunit [Elusimicrobia bacterium]|nr:twin-arginine translocase TatA/TatE family subunit [Elusimicrobiota bacterium]
MLPNIGYGEILIILVLALLLFGAKRIPEIARSLGKSINAFKAGLKEGCQDTDQKPPQETKPPNLP